MTKLLRAETEVISEFELDQHIEQINLTNLKTVLNMFNIHLMRLNMKKTLNDYKITFN